MSESPADTALSRARDHIAANSLPPIADLTAGSATALAWALKDQCYAAWSSEPQAAVRAAALLRSLRDVVQQAPWSSRLDEFDALVDWTAGIAQLVLGDMEAAHGAFDAAAARFTRLQMPHAAALTQVPKIMALAMLGRHDAAARCAEHAQRALLAQGDRLAASKVALNRAHLQMEADRYAAAAIGFGEAVELFDILGNTEHAVMARIGLADAQTALGDLEQASRTYAQAGACAPPQTYPVLAAMVEESKALLDLVRGHYRQALAGLEGSRRRYAELEMPQQLAIAHKQLADAYLELRMLPEALTGHAAAIERFRALDMQVELAWTLVQRGRGLSLDLQRSEAEAALSEAAALFDRLGNNTGSAAVALAQAELALANAESAQALAFARDAAYRFQQAGLVERRLRAQVVHARALLSVGDGAAAGPLLDSTLREANQHALLPVQLRCLTGRAMVALAADDRQAARADLVSATALFDELQQSLPGDELRNAFQSDHLWPFQALLGLDLEHPQAGQAGAENVLVQLDRFRARALADRLGLGRAHDTHTAGPVELPGSLDLRAKLAWLYRRLKQAEIEAAASAELTAELRSTEHELLERTRRNRLVGATANAPTVSSGLDVGDLRQALGVGDALIEYGVHGDELFACVVKRTGVQVVRHMAAWPHAIAAIRSLRFQMGALSHGNTPIRQHLAVLEHRSQGHLQRLHALVWQPLQPLLAACERVMVVPHAQLGAVPFAALHDGAHCLAEAVQLAFAPNARIATDVLLRKSAGATNVLALGESTRLPHAAREAQTARELLPEGWVFVGTEATTANLLAHASSADVIHLACHGQFRTDTPAFSALHLYDGPLTAETIESLHLGAATVVLSSCETALSDMRGGEEMFGLSRAFLVAGAARVVAALWSVDDATTLDFMADFYGSMRQGKSAAASLRQAQLAARQRHSHPFYWASFSLLGSW